ncbi:serine hydrolase [Tomitella biformata]|uniref:serine hydrolase n=1 Tax=Tomitella biformata TaxID=630403 RepID=UPI0004670F3A|nr:serine hydrolase [Tomitella biformata]
MTGTRRRFGRAGAPALSAVGVALAAAISLSACTTVPQPIPGLETPTAEAPAPEPTKPSPEQASAVPIPDGQIDAAVAQLDSLATGLLDSSQAPGLSVAVVRDGKTVYAKGFGVGDVATKTPVDADTVFPLGAASQALAATVVARQLGEQDLSWDTPVRQLLPTFTLADSYVSDHVTLGDLFAQRSGLPAHTGELAASLGFDRQQQLERLRYLPLTPFRATSVPSAIGVTAAGEAVAQAAGTDWASLSQRLLYEPLGMRATSSRDSDYRARADRAVTHVEQDGAFTVVPDAVEPDALSPAAGVSSSAADMGRWMAMVLDGGSAAGAQLIPAEDLLPALSPQSVPDPPATADARAASHGFGFDISTSAAGRVQLSAPSAAAAFTLIPSADVGIVVLSNASDSWVPAALTAQFADLVQTGAQTQDWPALAKEATAAAAGAATGTLAGATPPAKPTPTAALTSYDGVYKNDFFGPATVTTSNDSLILTLGPDGATFPLTHWDGGTFTMTPPAGAAPPASISRVVFADGVMQIEYLDQNGLGTFSKN